MEPSAVQLVDQRPGGSHDGRPRRAWCDRARTAPELGGAAPAAASPSAPARSSAEVRWRSTTGPAGTGTPRGAHRATATPASTAGEPPRALERRTAHVVEHEDRAEQHGGADHPHRRPARPATDDEHQPESEVDEDAEAVEERRARRRRARGHTGSMPRRVARSRATPPRTGVPVGAAAPSSGGRGGGSPSPGEPGVVAGGSADGFHVDHDKKPEVTAPSGITPIRPARSGAGWGRSPMLIAPTTVRRWCPWPGLFASLRRPLRPGITSASRAAPTGSSPASPAATPPAGGSSRPSCGPRSGC